MKRERDKFKLNKSKFISRKNLFESVILLIVLTLVTLGLIQISMAKYKKTVNMGTMDIKVETALQLTHTLSTTEDTIDSVSIYITPNHVKYKTYEAYGLEILEELENSIANSDELLEAKESLLLEGINYYDTVKGKWSGNGFDNLQNFVNYINTNEGSQYVDIYELMRDWNGYSTTLSKEQVLDNFLLYSEDYYIKPDKYIKTFASFQITNPDGTKVTTSTPSEIEFIAEESGDYVFQLENGLGDKTSVTIQIDNIVEGRFSKIYTQNSLYTDANGKTAWIPQGFAVGQAEDINKISEGLVITDKIDAKGDSIGNEFVWIPVNLTGTEAEKSSAFEKIRTTYGDSNYKEPYTSGYSTEAEEYNNMKASIIKYGGFYLGRYESGTSKLRYGISNGTSEDLVIKRGAYLYNYITWGYSMSNYTSDVTDLGGLEQGKGAVYLSKNMYTDYNTYGVVSTLCYGVQWDAAMDFIEEGSYDTSNSLTWGNYTNSSFDFTGIYSSDPASETSWTSVTNTKKPAGSKWLMTTGASEQNKSKNIYDLAGNVAEWTMEAYKTAYRVRRSGHRASTDSEAYAALRENYKPQNSLFSYGFRVALYIKDN